MDFSWKVFFSTIIMMLITFSIGGYILITTLFQTVYLREINSAKEENKIIQYSFVTTLSAITESENIITEDSVAEISSTVAKNISGENTQIRICNQKYDSIFESNKMEYDKEFLKKI